MVEAVAVELVEDVGLMLTRASGQARKVAEAHYRFRGCVVCGLQVEGMVTIAHLDHRAGNNAADNLAYLCWTHHRMFDGALYPIEAIKLMRARWQETEGIPRYDAVMKDAGRKAARTRARTRAALKAWETRRKVGP